MAVPRVVLPEPDSPIRPEPLAGRSANDTPSTALTGPRRRVVVDAQVLDRAGPRRVATHVRCRSSGLAMRSSPADSRNRPTKMNDDRHDRRAPPPPLAAQHGAELLGPVDRRAQRVHVVRPEPERLETDRRQHGAADGADEAGGDVRHQVRHDLAEQMPSSPSPLARATETYERSRIDSTCERIARVGCIHASAATVSPISSTVMWPTLAAMMTMIARLGTVISESASTRMTASIAPPKKPDSRPGPARWPYRPRPRSGRCAASGACRGP